MDGTANPSDMWNIIFTVSIVRDIFNWKYLKIDCDHKNSKQQSFTKNIEDIELPSLIGLFYYPAVVNQTIKGQIY